MKGNQSVILYEQEMNQFFILSAYRNFRSVKAISESIKEPQ